MSNEPPPPVPSRLVLIAFETYPIYFDEPPEFGHAMKGRDHWMKALFDAHPGCWIKLDQGAFVIRLPDAYALLHALVQGARQHSKTLIHTEFTGSIQGAFPQRTLQALQAFGVPSQGLTWS